ncbi:MAG TPA: restriction endonuclease [Anaerovoracaceae bacterium]|nr:restriction endonuclease [Anaerovoracaceae bacterium]
MGFNNNQNRRFNNNQGFNPYSPGASHSTPYKKKSKVGQEDWVDRRGKDGVGFNLFLAFICFAASHIINDFVSLPVALQTFVSVISWVGVGMYLIFALVALKRGKRVSGLYDKQSSLDSLARMNWFQFEEVVGEHFKRVGYSVTNVGGAKADGGIDIWLYKKGYKGIVQCKHYRGKVGVSIVREMYGVMVHEGADEVYIVGLHGFTRDAWQWAKGKPMKLISGKKIIEWKNQIQAGH